MPIPEHLVQQLDATIQAFQEHRLSRNKFLEAATILSAQAYQAVPGARAKHKWQDVFDAVTKWRTQAHAQDGKVPGQTRTAAFIAERFGYRKDQSVALAKTYRLWNLKLYARLTKTDISYLRKHFHRQWRESERNSKLVQKVFATVREAEALWRESERNLKFVQAFLYSKSEGSARLEDNQARPGTAQHVPQANPPKSVEKCTEVSKRSKSGGRFIESAEEVFQLLGLSRPSPPPEAEGETFFNSPPLQTSSSRVRQNQQQRAKVTKKQKGKAT